MKTEQEIREMKDKISKKIEITGENARSSHFNSYEREVYNREYAKLIAQYNILLDVLGD